jgi:hypothetical protein
MRNILVIALVLLAFTQVLGFNLEMFQGNTTTSRKGAAVSYQGSVLVGLVLSLIAYLFN